MTTLPAERGQQRVINLYSNASQSGQRGHPCRNLRFGMFTPSNSFKENRKKDQVFDLCYSENCMF